MTEINSASEISSMKIISVSGEVRSFSFQALEAAKNGDFDKYPTSAVAYGWFVWEKGYKGDPVVKWI